MNLRDSPKFKMGRTGEKLVAGLLRDRGWYVIPSYDYSGEDGNKPPRLEGSSDAFPIPDLDVAKRGARRWAEVKTKSAASYTRMTRQLEHGISARHCAAYQKVQKITGCEVWLFVLEQDTGDVLCERFDDLLLRVRRYAGPEMGSSGMVFFPRDAFRTFANIGRDSKGSAP